MEDDVRRQLDRRLKRAEGQLSGIRRMIETDQHCNDVLLQIAAVRGALGKIGQILLSSHVETCVTDAMRHGDVEERRREVDDLMEVFARFGGMSTR